MRRILKGRDWKPGDQVGGGSWAMGPSGQGRDWEADTLVFGSGTTGLVRKAQFGFQGSQGGSEGLGAAVDRGRTGTAF